MFAITLIDAIARFKLLTQYTQIGGILADVQVNVKKTMDFIMRNSDRDYEFYRISVMNNANVPWIKTIIFLFSQQILN